MPEAKPEQGYGTFVLPGGTVTFAMYLGESDDPPIENWLAYDVEAYRECMQVFQQGRAWFHFPVSKRLAKALS